MKLQSFGERRPNARRGGVRETTAAIGDGVPCDVVYGSVSDSPARATHFLRPVPDFGAESQGSRIGCRGSRITGSAVQSVLERYVRTDRHGLTHEKCSVWVTIKVAAMDEIQFFGSGRSGLYFGDRKSVV